MRKLFGIVVILLFVQCRDRYEYISGEKDRGLLVVEGMVNTNGNTSIRISRSSALSSTGTIPETGAVVYIEGDDNSTYQLNALDSGRFISNALSLPNDKKFRLKIITSNNVEYVSDFRQPVQTQDIDSISYQLENDKVQFYVNSTETNPRKYFFKYEWEETWQFHSSFRSIMKFVVNGEGDDKTVSIDFYDPINHSVNESIYTCWQSRKATSIDIGTTELFTESRIFLPVRNLRRDSWELGNIYSLLVKQYALGEDAYDFFRRMKKNSESLGSIFDAQPSDISGNIKNVNNPEEVVVGFIEITSVKEKRIFLNSEDLPGPAHDPGCKVFKGGESPYLYPFANDPEVLKYVYDHLDVLPTSYIEPMPGAIFYITEEAACVDCTERGTNVKPSFWP